jgi:hypothetical protein
VLQTAVRSEVNGRDEDKAAAAATLQQQLAAKDKELQIAAQRLAVAEKQTKSLEEAGKKHSADAIASALAEGAEQLSQAQQAHAQEMKKVQESHSKLIDESLQKHQQDIKALEKDKMKV